MWISRLDDAVGLSSDQRQVSAELLAGDTDDNASSLTPFEALSLSDEWMRLVAGRLQQAIAKLSPEQQRQRRSLLSPKQSELFILQITEKERKTDTREHGYEDNKGDNMEGRREIAEAAVTAHMRVPRSRERRLLAGIQIALIS